MAFLAMAFLAMAFLAMAFLALAFANFLSEAEEKLTHINPEV
jgi:hypothetical protein